MNARIDLAISAGLAEHTPAPTPDEPERSERARRLAAVLAPLTAVHLRLCGRTAEQRR
ncbi:hypothetical protein GCM10009854_26820 [Saccharopolyspora halophila]|uniref:Uncharacterized protein n=1 Tax=Saccharopolyspora halophila TaxID=405551 RepID=A0ABP5TC75_9PSEU